LLDLKSRLADRAVGKESSPIRELLKYMKIEDMISLGGGYPNPDTFVFDRVDVRFKDGSQSSLEGSELTVASQYGASDAHAGLRDELIAWHRGKDGVELNASQLVVTNGSQESLFIMPYLFANPDDSIALSEPAYPGALSAFKSFTKNFVSVPLDENGMDTAVLEKELGRIADAGGRLPKFIYTVPSGHNPGGVALSLARREHMMGIARRFDVLVLEDDPYQLVKLGDLPVLPSLQSMDTEGRVVRLDSFSKIFAPGLRIGYASGPPEIIRQFVLFKQSSNLSPHKHVHPGASSQVHGVRGARRVSGTHKEKLRVLPHEPRRDDRWRERVPATRGDVQRSHRGDVHLVRAA
jgi:2-aminoadipate transaminase